MTFAKLLPFGLLVSASVVACSDEGDGDNGGSGGMTGASGAPGSSGMTGSSGMGPGAGGAMEGCNTDFSGIAAANPAAVSFSSDVLPILRVSCNQPSCHGRMSTPKGGLYTGPGTGMPDPTPADIATIHANLLAQSNTAPAVPRIKPMDPGGSFLVRKITDTHTTQGYTCTPQGSMVPHACGDPMPPAGSTLCTQPNGQPRVDTIVRWVAQGALIN